MSKTILFEKINNILNNTEAMGAWLEKYEKKQEIKLSQFKRFEEKYPSTEERDHFIEKVLTKYSSDGYRNRFYRMGVQPQESFLWFMLEFAKYKDYYYEGDEEDGGYHVGSYHFEEIFGQGAEIIVTYLGEPRIETWSDIYKF